MCFRNLLGFWYSACVRTTVPEPAILAKASRTRLGETCRDSYSYPTRGYRSGGNSNLLSARMSRSGESLSPQREREECSVVGSTRSSGESVGALGRNVNSPRRV